jgi:hypothetical protein
VGEVTFGEGVSGYINKYECTGARFEVGDIVKYDGQKRCIVSKVKQGSSESQSDSDADADFDSDEESAGNIFKVVFTAKLKVSMTKANFSGLKLGPSSAMVIAAMLPKCQGLSQLTFGDDCTVTEADFISFFQKHAPDVPLRNIGGVSSARDLLSSMAGKKIVDECESKYNKAPVSSIGVELRVDMTEADFSGRILGDTGTIILTGMLPRCKYVANFISQPIILNL